MTKTISKTKKRQIKKSDLTPTRSAEQVLAALDMRLRNLPVTSDDPSYIRHASKAAFSELTQADMVTVLPLAKTGNIKARQALVLALHNMVAKMALKHRPSTIVAIDDLIQDGVSGVLKAIERYEIGSKASFATYAKHWIMREIKGALIETHNLHIPPYLHTIMLKIWSIQQHSKDPIEDPDVLVKILNDHYSESRQVSRAWVVQALRLLRTTVSSYDALERPLDTFMPLVNSAEEEYDESLLCASVRELLAELDENEQFVLRHKFEIGGAQHLTAEEMAKKMGIVKHEFDYFVKRLMKKLAAICTEKEITPALILAS